ncbi:MAG TPA: hypothetical protein VLJ17_24775 [Xanthobacteraceae bacterium]|nr:hypothetical protein [Xanthobacteraceae bacterium]
MNERAADPIADLISEWRTIDDFVKAETKRFGEHMAPARERLKSIETQLHQFLLDNKIESISKKGLGTAYISELMDPKVENVDATLDWALENYDAVGPDFIKVSPKIEAIRSYMADHDNQTPPGITVSYYRRVNVRRT